MLSEEDMRAFAIEVAEGLEGIAAEYRQANRSEVPMTVHFIRFPEQEGAAPEVLPMDPEQMGTSKEEVASSIRLLVQLLGARYVILMHEAWASYTGTQDELAAVNAWTTAGKSLSEFPGRREILMVSLDGPDAHLMLSRTIQADGSVGERVRMEGLETHGRLANLSHPQATNGSEVWN
jgi:hypothetical protein